MIYEKLLKNLNLYDVSISEKKLNDILDFVRFEVGEGIEKNTEDFADEVMKTISN